MAMTPEDAAAVAALDKAEASGVLRVRFKDRDVTYRSLAEIRQTKAGILAKYQQSAGFGVSYPRTGKGLL